MKTQLVDLKLQYLQNKYKILSLPIFPEIQNSQIRFISNVIKGELFK